MSDAKFQRGGQGAEREGGMTTGERRISEEGLFVLALVRFRGQSGGEGSLLPLST
jgi:hypothetical protein